MTDDAHTSYSKSCYCMGCWRENFMPRSRYWLANPLRQLAFPRKRMVKPNSRIHKDATDPYPIKFYTVKSHCLPQLLHSRFADLPNLASSGGFGIRVGSVDKVDTWQSRSVVDLVFDCAGRRIFRPAFVLLYRYSSMYIRIGYASSYFVENNGYRLHA